MICILCKFGKRIYLVTVDDDVIGVKTTRLLEKCGKMVFKIVSPTDDFEILRQ